MESTSVGPNKLSAEEIHKIAKQPLPKINVIKPVYTYCGNRIFRESINRTVTD